MSPGRFFASDGTGIAYVDEGAGLPLVCLSGLTRNGRDFDYLAPHLPPCRMIRMDYRGRGRSDWSGPQSYTVPREALDARELLDHLGIARAAVLGTSRGGIVGMLLAATARDRLLGLCLNDVGPVLERAGIDRIRAYIGRDPAARNLDEAAGMLAAAAEGFEAVPPGRWRDEAARHFVVRPDGRLAINYDPALAEAFARADAASPPDFWPLFDACAGLPLALIRGANSDLLSVATAAEMRRRRPDMIVAEVPGRGHIPFLDEPEAVAAVRAWLARVAAGAPA